MIETVADVIVAEWEGGARDDAICEQLNRSGIHPPAPHTFRTWTPARLREVAGQRPRNEVRR